MDMLPPGPRNAVWQTLRYLRDPTGWIAAMARKYGDPFTVPTLVRPLVVTGSSEGVRSIFSADPDTFTPFAGEAGVPLLGRGGIPARACAVMATNLGISRRRTSRVRRAAASPSRICSAASRSR
jgi:hypothetical protein